MAVTVDWWRTKIDEGARARITAAIDGENFSNGPVTAELERKFAESLGVPHALLVPSGSAALLMAMVALGIGPGDEVIAPNITWIASIHGAALLGAKVILVDTEADRPLMHCGAVERAITPRTKAIVPVHLNGRAVDMKRLRSLAARHGIRIVEDAAQALFSRSADGYLGTLGDVGCYSLGMTKLISSGQGGLVVTRDESLYRALHTAKYHGVVTDANGDETYTGLGFNMKFNDLAASLAFDQVLTVDERIARVTRIYRAYEAGLGNLPNIRLIEVNVDEGEVPLWTEIRSSRREELMAYLAEHGIGTRRLHPPLHHARHLVGEDVDFPNSIAFGAEGLILPCGPWQPLETVERVISLIRDWRP